MNDAGLISRTSFSWFCFQIRFIVTLILTFPNAILGLKVAWQYWSSGNLIFKTVGADMRLQRMCRTMFFGMSLLVFDAQAFVSCLILIIERGIEDLTDEDKVIISTGVAFTVLWLALGYTAVSLVIFNVCCCCFYQLGNFFIIFLLMPCDINFGCRFERKICI